MGLHARRLCTGHLSMVGTIKGLPFLNCCEIDAVLSRHQGHLYGSISLVALLLHSWPP